MFVPANTEHQIRQYHQPAEPIKPSDQLFDIGRLIQPTFFMFINLRFGIFAHGNSVYGVTPANFNSESDQKNRAKHPTAVNAKGITQGHGAS